MFVISKGGSMWHQINARVLVAFTNSLMCCIYKHACACGSYMHVCLCGLMTVYHILVKR